jgi:hypothetical protein
MAGEERCCVWHLRVSGSEEAAAPGRLDQDDGKAGGGVVYTLAAKLMTTFL